MVTDHGRSRQFLGLHCSECLLCSLLSVESILPIGMRPIALGPIQARRCPGPREPRCAPLDGISRGQLGSLGTELRPNTLPRGVCQQHRSAPLRSRTGRLVAPCSPPIPGSRTAGSNAGSSGWTEHPGELLRAGGRCRWSGRCAATSACVPHNQCLSRGSLTDRPDSHCRTAGFNARSSGWTEHPGALLRAGACCRWSGRCAPTPAGVPHNQCLSWGSLTDRPDSDCRTAGFNVRSSGWTEHPGALLRAGACYRWSGAALPHPHACRTTSASPGGP